MTVGSTFSWIFFHILILICLVFPFFLVSTFFALIRGYQRIGENITKGIPDIHEAIDVSMSLQCVPLRQNYRVWSFTKENQKKLFCFYYPWDQELLTCGQIFKFQCYTEMEPGRYGSLGKPMEGSNLWYVYFIKHHLKILFSVAA